MTDLCTALADALRKADGKWTDKFEVHGKTFSMRHNEEMWYTQLDRLDDIDTFTLDFMDAVAAALGMMFLVDINLLGMYYGKIYYRRAGTWECFKISEPVYTSKREASLAALLAIITHALEDGK
jgi:phage gp29-like protein